MRLVRLAEALEVGVGHFFAGLEPVAGVRPASTEGKLLTLARDFARPPGCEQGALAGLARALAGTHVG